MAKKMLRVPDVMARIGWCRITLWRRVRDGLFPAPIELGSNMIGWHEEEVEEWIEAQPRRTYARGLREDLRRDGGADAAVAREAADGQ